ncbi:MAG: hypothetical protein KDA49_07730 [Rhodospirillaceae bacterium]|nr:hypothetical protein [Rhodospirillaceae bacterium]MCA8932345.1 hypothetical protein [Rhodospirillaceae bacterium]
MAAVLALLVWAGGAGPALAQCIAYDPIYGYPYEIVCPTEEVVEPEMQMNPATDPVSGSNVSFIVSFATSGLSFTGLSPDLPNGGGTDGGAAAAGQTGSFLPLIGFQFGRYSTDGVEAEIYSAPIRFNFGIPDTDIVAEVDAPLSFVTINGDTAVFGSVGVGFRLPELWESLTLTPQFRFGVLNSNDLNAGVVGYGTSLRSIFEHDFTGLGFVDYLHIQLANLSGIYWVDDWQALQTNGNTYNLQNVLFRNGISVSFPTNVLSQEFEITLFGTDTRVFGDETYLDQFNEAGVVFEWRDPPLPYTNNPITFGITFTRSPDGSGISVNTGYRF